MSERSAFPNAHDKLARTLEEGICQDLAGITLFCEAIVRKLRLQESPLEQDAVRVRDLLEQAKQDLRRVSCELQKSGGGRKIRGLAPANAASRGRA